MENRRIQYRTPVRVKMWEITEGHIKPQSLPENERKNGQTYETNP